MMTIDTLFDTIPDCYDYFVVEDWETVGCAFKAYEVDKIAELMHENWAEWDDDAWTVDEIKAAVLSTPAGSGEMVAGLNVYKAPFLLFCGLDEDE